jgi:hypothetical protein
MAKARLCYGELNHGRFPLLDRTGISEERAAEVILKKIEAHIKSERPPCVECKHHEIHRRSDSFGAGEMFVSICKQSVSQCPDVIYAKEKEQEAKVLEDLKRIESQRIAEMKAKVIEAEMAFEEARCAAEKEVVRRRLDKPQTIEAEVW